MLEQLSPAVCDLWIRHVKQYAYRYGPQMWHIVYQAEARARMEHLPRVKRRGQLEHKRATDSGGTHEFAPDKPWEWTFRATVEDATYLRKEREEPAIMAPAKASRPAEHIVGDIAVSGSSSQGGLHHLSREPKLGDRSRNREEPKKKAKPERQHVTNKEGALIKNRAGRDLCEAYQSGEARTRDVTADAD